MRASLRRTIFCGLVTLAIANVFALLAIRHLEQVDSSKLIQLVPRENELVLLSRTNLGGFRLERFASWMSFEKHLEQNNLKLKAINDVFVNPNLEAFVKGTKIIWGSNDKPKIVDTPDYLSTQRLFPYVKYGNIQGSPIGYAIEVEPVADEVASNY